MAKSIIFDYPYCFICGSPRNLHTHHIFNGPFRRKSDRDGLVIPLCARCHDYTHTHKELMKTFYRLGEKEYLIQIGDYESYMKRYKTNWLEEHEIKDCLKYATR